MDVPEASWMTPVRALPYMAHSAPSRYIGGGGGSSAPAGSGTCPRLGFSFGEPATPFGKALSFVHALWQLPHLLLAHTCGLHESFIISLAYSTAHCSE